ncbi:MAG: DUF1655 domain-containing protein [Nitrososphaerales archaeon]
MLILKLERRKFIQSNSYVKQSFSGQGIPKFSTEFGCQLLKMTLHSIHYQNKNLDLYYLM